MTKRTLNLFKAAVEKAADGLAERELVKFHKRVVFDALGRIIEKTPVDTGRTRANWQVTIGDVPTSIIEAEDREGGNTSTAGLTKLAALRPFQVVNITNNVDHIEVLEHGLFDPSDPGPSKDKRPGRKGEVLVRGGYSVQAPVGMVMTTVEELRAIYA